MYETYLRVVSLCVEVSVSAFESSAQIAQEEALMLEMEAKRLRDENMRLRAQVRTPLPHAAQEEAAASAAWLFDSTSNSSARDTLSFGSSMQVGYVCMYVCLSITKPRLVVYKYVCMEY